MSTVKFNLKKTGDDATIFLIFNFGYYELSSSGAKIYKYLKLSTKEKIKVSQWDHKQQRCKIMRGFPDAAEINFKLEKLKAEVISIQRTLVNDNKPVNPDIIKNKLKEKDKKSKFVSSGLVDYATRFKDISDRSEKTKTGYNGTINILIRYQEKIKKTLCFDDITMNFYHSFVGWLKDDEYSINSIGTVVKNIKVFMGAALDEKLHTNFDFHNKKFKVLSEETDSIYLNENEILKLYKTVLDAKLSKWRDMFIISCYTGLRFSDFSTLQNANFSEQYLTKVTKKTGSKIVIPLHPIVKEILLKYNGNLPKICSNQKFNEYLKTIGEIAKINEDVLVTRKEGLEKKTYTFKKYQLLTCHSGRRSFATNAMLSGVNHQAIMQFTGHKNYKTFVKYLKMSSEENAEKLREHSFFN